MSTTAKIIRKKAIEVLKSLGCSYKKFRTDSTRGSVEKYRTILIVRRRLAENEEKAFFEAMQALGVNASWWGQPTIKNVEDRWNFGYIFYTSKIK